MRRDTLPARGAVVFAEEAGPREVPTECAGEEGQEVGLIMACLRDDICAMLRPAYMNDGPMAPRPNMDDVVMDDTKTNVHDVSQDQDGLYDPRPTC